MKLVNASFERTEKNYNIWHFRKKDVECDKVNQISNLAFFIGLLQKMSTPNRKGGGYRNLISQCRLVTPLKTSYVRAVFRNISFSIQ